MRFLLENGSHLLLEDGHDLLLEGAAPPPPTSTSEVRRLFGTLESTVATR